MASTLTLLALIAVAIYVWKNKRLCSSSADYRGIFIVGVCVIPIWPIFDLLQLCGIGIIYIALGLAKRKEWGKKQKFSKKTIESKKKNMLAGFVIRVFLLMLGFAFIII